VDDEFISLYPATSNTALAARFGVHKQTIQRWASRLGLRKDLEYRRNIQRLNSTGRALSPESRAKIAAAAKGRKMSEQTKAKILQTKRERGTLAKGERHYKWKGGKPWARFKEPRYVEWRNAVLARDNYVCRHCGRKCRKYERGLAAHHVKEYATHPDLRYDVSNGITLCRQCHLSLHGRAPAPRPQVPCGCGCGTLINPFDVYGRPRRYVNHHARRGQPFPESAKEKLRAQRAGRKLSAEHRAKIAQGLRTSDKRIGRPPKR
jgi:hypothetical protein